MCFQKKVSSSSSRRCCCELGPSLLAKSVRICVAKMAAGLCSPAALRTLGPVMHRAGGGGGQPARTTTVMQCTVGQFRGLGGQFLHANFTLAEILTGFRQLSIQNII